jgi:hypothetical protein
MIIGVAEFVGFFKAGFVDKDGSIIQPQVFTGMGRNEKEAIGDLILQSAGARDSVEATANVDLKVISL